MNGIKGNKPILLLLTILNIIFIGPSVLGQDSIFQGKKVSHSIYITANTGTSPKTDILEVIASQSLKEKSTSLLLVGNITNKKGYPIEERNRESVNEFLRKDLLIPIKDFNGKVFFTPGVNEWNPAGPESINDLKIFLKANRQPDFQLGNDCPIERQSINENIELINVDSQWFLEDWDKYPSMNVNCTIKTRDDFFTEFRNNLKNSQGKLVIVAIHHPVLSNSTIPFFKKVTGASPSHFESSRQKELKGKLETLASLFDDVIFVSGNHKNLQLLYNDRNPQIISGAAAEEIEPAKMKKDGLFTSPNRGFVKVTVFEDLSAAVVFYEMKKEQARLVYSYSIQRERPVFDELKAEYPKQRKKMITSSIYTSEETSKNVIYKGIWGNRHRKVYSQPIEVKALYLDSITKNSTSIVEGSSRQTRSLTLINDRKNKFTLRALRKDPIQYLQTDIIQTNFVGDFLENTIAQRFIADFFTTAHPYATFAVNDLSSRLNILHANTKLYYLPKQKALGIYNEDYGNALYILEDHFSDNNNKELKVNGSPANIISTADLLQEMLKSKESYVDRKAYLRARIFDMLIGDWDRNGDQWRWAGYHENNRKRYLPISKNRDHAFPKYDGLLFPIIKSIEPSLRKMQSYEENLENVKWFNFSGNPLDQQFISEAGWTEWKEQAAYIQNNLTDEAIEKAFATLPKEVIGNSEISEIKKNLKRRRDHLLKITKDYYNYFRRFQSITGTMENDKFQITREPNGITQVNITNRNGVVFNAHYTSSETKEIWIYGLKGEDTFQISGKGNELIKLKVIGGVGEDVYDFQNPKKAKLYDFKSTKSDIQNPSSRKWLVDSYDINHFHYKKRKYSENSLIPVIDYVTDAGFTVGIKDIYSRYGLAQNPFSSQYILSAQYFFASNGFEVNASAEFAHVFYDWNFMLEGRYSSPNYFINYFGSGNESVYDRDDVSKEYNRVKLEQWEFHPSFNWRSDAGAYFSAGPLLETVQVGYTQDSFLGENFSAENNIFDLQVYSGVESRFSYENKNNPSYPSLGTRADLIAGYKQNIDGASNKFAYFKPSLSLDYPLIPSGFAVFATKLGGTANVGDQFEFYHGATLGGNRSLRGYRNHRFNGKYSFYHSTDLRTAVGLIRTDFVPLIVGVSLGYDYGRVWLDNDTSGQWHTNYGGSFWVNGFYALTANFGFYHGGDGNRFTFTVNFKY